MNLNVFMFYLLSGIILTFSVLTITSRRMLRAAVYLLFVLVATSGLYFLLNYQFLAAIQLTLYAGGIVVLIIFSILLTGHISEKFKNPAPWKLWMGTSVFIVGSTVALWAMLSNNLVKGTGVEEVQIDMHLIGNQLMGVGKNGFVLPFEIISILLLASMVAAIVIAKKKNN